MSSSDELILVKLAMKDERLRERYHQMGRTDATRQNLRKGIMKEKIRFQNNESYLGEVIGHKS